MRMMTRAEFLAAAELLIREPKSMRSANVLYRASQLYHLGQLETCSDEERTNFFRTIKGVVKQKVDHPEKPADILIDSLRVLVAHPDERVGNAAADILKKGQHLFSSHTQVSHMLFVLYSLHGSYLVERLEK